MKKILEVLTATTLLVACTILPSYGASIGVQPQPRSALVHGAQALEPFSNVLFCLKQPLECQRADGPSVVDLRGARYSQLKRINRSVNRAIVPQNDDPSVMGGDIWTLSPARGDCEDYALTKRHKLIAAGWPAAALRLAIAYTPRGEGHMVLLVSTTDGDIVLDSLRDDIRNWNATGLRWKMVQSGENPRTWYQI